MTNISGIDFGDYLTRCVYPRPAITDVEAWNSIDFGTGTTAVAKVGLFGYDISCLNELCFSALDANNYCGQLYGIDGLSFGIHTEIKTADSGADFYCVGFPDAEFGATAACVSEGSPTAFTFLPIQGYQITETVFDADIAGGDAVLNQNYDGFYGLLRGNFAEGEYILSTTIHKRSQWRFIHPEENDGLRWAPGDTIDLFALDFEAEVFTDNDGFELAGALHLTAAGATLIAAVMLM
jgi:hypothetical protein